MATDIKLKDYIFYKYKERIKEKRTHYMLSIISSGNRGCSSSRVPIREPPLLVIDVLRRLKHGERVTQKLVGGEWTITSRL
jgi:hypothetical protein